MNIVAEISCVLTYKDGFCFWHRRRGGDTEYAFARLVLDAGTTRPRPGDKIIVHHPDYPEPIRFRVDPDNQVVVE